MNSQDLTKAFLELLKQKEQIEIDLSKLTIDIAVTSEKLHDMMVDEGIDSHEIEGIKFEPLTEQDFRLREANQNTKWDEFPPWFAWLKQTGNQDLIKTKESVAWNTRKKFLREYVEAGQNLPEFIKETFYNTVKWNKSAVERLVKSTI